MSAPTDRVAAALPDRRRVALAPGRVNLLGEHTDYNQGYVLPAAIDRHVAAAFAPRPTRVLRLRSLDLDDVFDLSLDDLDDLLERPDRFADLTRGPAGWRRYAAGVALERHREGRPLEAGEVTVAGDVPRGAGLSSSAALEAALDRVLAGGPEPGPEAALRCQRAEERWAGVPCGVMDQFAVILGRAGHLLLLDCRDLSVRHVPLPAGLALTVVDPGLPRNLADGAYRRRRDEIETALALLRKVVGPLESLRDLDPAAFEEVADLLPDPLRRRVRHVVTAIARVPEGVTALALGDVAAFGRLMYACHRSLADDYEVSLPELDAVVSAAARIEGVVGARLTGAGFGGCAVVLHQEGCEEDLRAGVTAGLPARAGRPPDFHHLHTADGARLVEDSENSRMTP